MTKRIICSVCDRHRKAVLNLVEQVFTDHENASEGKLVRTLVEQIRAGRFYLPELEITAVDENDQPVGYAMFSRFHLEGKYENELLILTPVAVKTELQRQHISKDMLEFGFERAREMGFSAVIVEGNPANYRARGFVTAANHGILPGKTVHLPHIDCLMVKELKTGTLENIHGRLEYSYYPILLDE